MNTSSAGPISLAALALVIAAACTTPSHKSAIDAGNADDQDGGEDTRPDVLDPSCCATDSACATGERCLEGYCVETPRAGRCWTDADCDGETACMNASSCPCPSDCAQTQPGYCLYCCSTDADCDAGTVCVAGGCVPEAEDGACWSDADCQGTSCTGVIECPCGEVCSEPTMPGRCCVPNCANLECGGDGCGGSCGECPEGCGCNQGSCLCNGLEEVELAPLCVHVPDVVGAASPFSIAVFGQGAGCASFDRAEITVNGFEVDIRLVGLVDTIHPCPPCIYDWIGLVELEVPQPGGYTVRMGGDVVGTFGASGGIVDDPICQDDCGTPALDEGTWTLSHVSSQTIAGGCGTYQNVGTALSFDGSCQDYNVVGDDWTFATQANHCTDARILLGQGPPYTISATVCDNVGEFGQRLILGTANEGFGATDSTQVFLIEGQ